MLDSGHLFANWIPIMSFLQGRYALKAMVEVRYMSEKEKVKAKVEKVAAVSLTSDMWTSINMDAYLAVTCHFVEEKVRLSSVLLGVQSHTAEILLV
ncbi:hypothetical protein WMY93_012083 [Mugilogobius chulae]|uniref:Transposase n=1 Tax=Mugilogobius chulae TaxID=88201 RepID=A0AAW0P7W2_9GOBI